MRGISKKSILIRAVLTFVWICLWVESANADPVIAAYQEIYSMNFQVLHQPWLPSGWYVTGDGYPVAQVRPNHWVYGRSPHQGILIPTEVAVGAVVPINVPQLARVALPSWRGGVYDTEQFRTITLSKFDNMGVLDDPLAYTPVAWKSGRAELRVWLGDRWYTIVPRARQSTTQALIAQHPYIVRTLNEKSVPWTMVDTLELADLAREWGYLWHGHIPFAYLPGYRDTGSSGNTARTVIGGGIPGAGSGSVPGGGGNSGMGEWDIGGGNSGNTGNTGGGGWSSSGGSSGNTGGGWGSGGTGGWGSSGNTGGDSENTSGGSSWDK